MRPLFLVFALALPSLSFAAPSSGLLDTDTFLFGFTQTWSAEFPMDAQDGVEICVVATSSPQGLPAGKRSWHRAATAKAEAGESPCAAIALPNERFVSVKTFGPEQVHDAFFNHSPQLNAPLQRSFESRVAGKSINEAYAELRKSTSDKPYTYFVMVAHTNESWGTTFPLPHDGVDSTLDPSTMMSNSRGAFEFSNFYSHHVSR